MERRRIKLEREDSKYRSLERRSERHRRKKDRINKDRISLRRERQILDRQSDRL